MSGIIEFIFGYVALIIFWGIFNIFFYSLSILFKKAFTTVPFAINMFINWGIQIYFIVYPLYILWQIIVAKEWLILVLALIFGGFIIGWWQTITGLLTYPFTMITAYFVQKTDDKFNEKEEEFDYEILSPEGKVIERNVSDSKKQKQTAKWFVIAYGISFVNQFLTRNKDYSLGPIWFVILPLITVLITSIIVAVFVGVFNLFKYRKFIGKGKEEFIISILKGDGILYLITFLLNLIYYYG